MTAGAATRPPARARLDLGDGPRPLVEVLSRPDVLGKVDVRLPDGERRTVPARWLDPEDDAALDLLTSGDRGIQRAAAPAPRPANDLLAALAAAQPVSFARAARLLGLRHTPKGPDHYLPLVEAGHVDALVPASRRGCPRAARRGRPRGARPAGPGRGRAAGSRRAVGRQPLGLGRELQARRPSGEGAPHQRGPRDPARGRLAEARAGALRAAVEAAPHDDATYPPDGCAALRGGRCNCWKSRALGERAPNEEKP